MWKAKRNKSIPPLIALLLASLVIVLLPYLVYAIGAPSTLQINSVYAYQHLLEDNDQLYLVEYTLDYGTNPDEPISEAYLGRLMQGSSELGNIAPYAYYDGGYDQGIFSVYFTAASVPAWSGNYTMRLEGNPTLSWLASDNVTAIPVPTTGVSSFDVWSTSTSQATTEEELTARLLYIADQLELAWGVDLVETTATGTKLTAYGESYFCNAVENLRAACPDMFSASVSVPEFPEREHERTFLNYLENQWGGTWVEEWAQGYAGWLGMQQLLFTSLAFMLFVVIMLVFAAQYTMSVKPLMLMAAVLMIYGARIGMLAGIVPFAIAFLAALGVGYFFFYRQAA